MISIIESPSKKSVGVTSLKIKFDYNEKIISIIKEIGDAVWDKKELCWEMPICHINRLIEELSIIDDIDIRCMDKPKEETLKITQSFKTPPFDYQLEGIEWLLNHRNSLLLDPPGLGKTLQMIYVAEELKAQKHIEHCLILCGINTLKTNWKKEIERHSKYSCRIIGEKISKKGNVSYSSTKERAEELFKPLDDFFIILNIESLRESAVIDAIRNSSNKFDMIVFDEVHKAKSPTATQTKNLFKLKNVGNYHYGLTGTVLVNSPLDAYVPLRFIEKERACYSTFKEFYCTFEVSNIGFKQLVGFKHMNILRQELQECSLRRDKSILNLPPKIIVPEYLSMKPDQQKFYEDLSNGVIEDVDKVHVNTSTLLSLVTRLRQAATCPSVLSSKDISNCKFERAIELVEEIISNGEKVVIFSAFKEPVYALKEALSSYNPLLGTGDILDEEVAKNIEKFQTDDNYKVFLGTLSKMSTGVTLTAASYMILIDSPWTAAEFEQACDRIYRIGSKKSVTIYSLINSGTIDERVQQLIDTKKGISEVLVDNNFNQKEELLYLLGLN